MKKIIIALCVISILMISVGFVVAGRNPNQGRDRVFSLPENAVEVAPGVFHLGYALDNGRVVEGYAMFVKPTTECGNGICEPGENINKCPEDCSGGEDPTEPDTSSCYTFLAKGAKWKTVENYIVDPANSDGLEDSFITSNLALNIGKWETAAGGHNILGDEIEGIVNGADLVSPDNKNEVYFDNLGETNTIAFAVVWGIFRGPPFARELVEWDIVFNDAFDWSAAGEADKMDFENIATHELGHAVGLGDLYTDACSEQTMYGYSWEGDIQKRDLALGDIAGITALYN